MPFRALLFAAIVLAALPTGVAAAEKLRRIAVLPFENAGRERTLDWHGTGIAETLTTQLSSVPDLAVVERTRLNDILKELKFGRSQFVDPGTAQKMGKMINADAMVVGSFQKFQDNVRINARLVDVETAEVRAPVMVDGAYAQFLDLEVQVAKRLMAAIKGAAAAGAKESAGPAAPATRSMEASRFFSEGVYFYRNDLLDDALGQLEEALKLDPAYGEAHYYRGLVLQKKQRWDDAIAAFKRALPRSEQQRQVRWSWDVPYEGDPSERGSALLFDVRNVDLQSVFFGEARLLAPQRIVYSERKGASTVLHFVDLHQRTTRRLLLEDPNVLLSQISLGTDRAFVLASFKKVRAGEIPDKVTFYLMSPTQETSWWRLELDGKSQPLGWLLGDRLYVYFRRSNELVAVDLETRATQWLQKAELAFFPPPALQNTKKHGDVLVFRSPQLREIRVLRVSDGADAWRATLETKDANVVVRDGVVAVLEPGRRVAAFDLETGASLPVPTVRPDTVNQNTPLGNIPTTPAALRDGVLYFLSREQALFALDLRATAKGPDRVLWQTPINRKVFTLRPHEGRLYVGAESGELLILDGKTGRVDATVKVGDKNLAVDHIRDSLLIASSSSAVHALDARTGAAKWEFRNTFSSKDPVLFKGVLCVRTGDKTMSVLDVENGTLLWPYAGKRLPIVHTTEQSLFIAQPEGVKEYSVEKTSAAGLTDKEVFTELANTFLLKGNLDDADWHANKVTREIDPNFPSARRVRARVLKARGNAGGAARELAVYLNLVGRRAPEARNILQELTTDHGLRWHAELNSRRFGEPREIQGKLVARGFIRDDEPRLHAVEAADGRVAWRHAGQRFIVSEHAPASGQVFFGTGDREQPQQIHLFSVALSSGEKKKLATLAAPGAVTYALLSHGDKVLYLETLSEDVQERKSRARVFALDPASGSTLWEKSHEFEFGKPPGIFGAVGDHLVYSIEKDLWAVRGSDGAIQAKHTETSSIMPGRPSQAGQEGGLFYFATADHSVIAYSLAQKQALYRIRVPGIEETGHLLSAGAIRNGTLFENDHKSVFAADLNPQTPEAQRIKWRLQAGGDQRFWRPFFAGDRLYVYRNDGIFLELDPASGKVVAERPLLWDPDEILVHDKAAYVFTSDGLAYALKM